MDAVGKKNMCSYLFCVRAHVYMARHVRGGRGQLPGVSSLLLLWGYWGLNLGPQAWWQPWSFYPLSYHIDTHPIFETGPHIGLDFLFFKEETGGPASHRDPLLWDYKHIPPMPVCYMGSGAPTQLLLLVHWVLYQMYYLAGSPLFFETGLSLTWNLSSWLYWSVSPKDLPFLATPARRL